MSQEEKFLGGEIECYAGSNRSAPVYVDFQIIDAQLLFVRYRRTPKQRANARHQLGKHERLYQIVVRT